MLPTQLSNGICSLNPQEDRFAFSCLMRLDEQGNILGYNFVKSVIRSRVKGVYKEINALLESMAAETTEPVEADEAAEPIDPEMLNALKEKYAEVLEQLPIMDELYRKRLVLRKQRGGMDIESDEAKLIIDENGRCVDIVKRGRGTSECMIEEFMLLANQCAANAGRTNKVPFVYRVHEAPRCREDGKAVCHAAGLRPERQIQEPHPHAAGTGCPAGRDPRSAHPDPPYTPASCAACRRPVTPRSPWATTAWCWRTTLTLPALSAVILIWPSIASSARCCWAPTTPR